MSLDGYIDAGHMARLGLHGKRKLIRNHQSPASGVKVDGMGGVGPGGRGGVGGEYLHTSTYDLWS